MSEISTPARIDVLGVKINALNLFSARELVRRALEEKQKGYICFANVYSVMSAQEDVSLQRILNESFLTTPDGMPMVWLGKLKGFAEMGRVYGPDLMTLVCEMTRNTRYKHFLYGGVSGVAEKLKSALEKKHPGIKIVGTYTPPFRPLTPAEENELIRITDELKPDIIWVGLGTPKQDRFMADYLPKLDATLFFGVGAAFDFFSGRVRQAPKWIQRSGFEWLYRLFSEPRRLSGRYLKTNPLFLAKIIGQTLGFSAKRKLIHR